MRTWQSAQIKNKYESEFQKIESDLSNKEKQLQTAMAENEQKIQKYNELLKFYRGKTQGNCDPE
jgi:Skp family chaperone for outer membrane proteins